VEAYVFAGGTGTRLTDRHVGALCSGRFRRATPLVVAIILLSLFLTVNGPMAETCCSPIVGLDIADEAYPGLLQWNGPSFQSV